MNKAIRLVGYMLLFGGFIAVIPVERMSSTQARRVVAVQQAKLDDSKSFARHEVWAEMDELAVALEQNRYSTFPCACTMLTGALILMWCRNKRADVCSYR